MKSNDPGEQASKAAQRLAKEFREQRVAEVESKAYQLAKEAFLTSDEAKTAFMLLLEEIFELHEIIRKRERQEFEFWCALRGIEQIRDHYEGLKDNITNDARRTFYKLVGYEGVMPVSSEELIKEKGPVLFRLDKIEQKLRALRPEAATLREDGKFLEDYEKFKQTMELWKNLLFDHLRKPKWWQFWKRRKK